MVRTNRVTTLINEVRANIPRPNRKPVPSQVDIRYSGCGARE